MRLLAAQPWADLLAVWALFALNVATPGPNVFDTIGIALGSGGRGWRRAWRRG